MTGCTSPDSGLSRAMYELVETVHIALYVAGEPRQAYVGLGLPPGYSGYVAARCAPLGPVGPEIAVATFYVFSSRLLGECLPAAWAIAAPETVLCVRLQALDVALRRILGPLIGSPALVEAAALLEQGCSALQPAGRVLYAAHAALPVPAEPHLAAWHWATLLREHRGDGHVAALLLSGLDPVETLLLHAAIGGDRSFLQQRRGWSAGDWSAAEVRLRDRGLIDSSGLATTAGRDLRATVEARTDAASSHAWRALGSARCHRLAALLRPVVHAIRAADLHHGGTRRVGLRHG